MVIATLLAGAPFHQHHPRRDKGTTQWRRAVPAAMMIRIDAQERTAARFVAATHRATAGALRQSRIFVGVGGIAAVSRAPVVVSRVRQVVI